MLSIRLGRMSGG